jgi:dTDP-4-amino-4,6-dideoxygalactose transaminase
MTDRIITEGRAHSEPIPSRSVISHSSPDIGEEEIAALIACARSLQVNGGERVSALETQVACDLGYAGAVATTSGTQAIHLALRALFPGGGALVGVPSYLCRSVYDAIHLAACKPYLLDIDPRTFSTSIDQAKPANLDAVIVAHMFGIRAPIESFLDAGLVVIEDCAQRLAPKDVGAAERKATVRVLSLEATKLLTSGSGGLLLCDETQILERASKLRDGPYDFFETALWLSLTDLQAAIALVQWQRLPSFLERRRWLAGFYLSTLEGKYPKQIVPAMRHEHTFQFRFLLRVDDPARFIQHGFEHGVIFRRPVAPLPLHELFKETGNFQVTDDAFAHLVSIPLYPSLTNENAERVAKAAVQALSTGV